MNSAPNRKTQKLSALSRGKATSRAPICSGMRKFAKNPSSSGMTTMKIMVVPCIVNIWL